MREKIRTKNDVEIPATVYTVPLQDSDLGQRNPFNFLVQKQQRERARWLNSPNSYLKVNVPERSLSGECSPRTKTMVSCYKPVFFNLPCVLVDYIVYMQYCTSIASTSQNVFL